MLWIGIDTSGSKGSIALSGDREGILFYETCKGHFEGIDVAIEELLERSGAHLRDIDGISVISGPGYFTGLRVGVAYARGLAMALFRPLAFVTGFEAMCWALSDGKFLLGVEMGRNQCCVLKVVKQGRQIVEKEGPYHMRKEHLDLFVREHSGWSACGEPFVPYEGTLPIILGGPDAYMAASAAMEGAVEAGSFLDCRVEYECPGEKNSYDFKKNKIKEVKPWNRGRFRR